MLSFKNHIFENNATSVRYTEGSDFEPADFTVKSTPIRYTKSRIFETLPKRIKPIESKRMFCIVSTEQISNEKYPQMKNGALLRLLSEIVGTKMLF